MKAIIKIIDDRILFEIDGKCEYYIERNKTYRYLGNTLFFHEKKVVSKTIHSTLIPPRVNVELYFHEEQKSYFIKQKHFLKFSLQAQFDKDHYLIISHDKGRMSIYCNDEMIGYVSNRAYAIGDTIIKVVHCDDDLDLDRIFGLIMGAFIRFDNFAFNNGSGYTGFQLRKFDTAWRPKKSS